MLEAHGIRVALGRREILHSVDLRAAPGALSCIVGPNGSGKTTLLRALTGDARHDGTVSINGRDTARLRAWELAALRGVLPQAATLAFPFTVTEVVRIGLRAGDAGEHAEIAAAALGRVGLAGYAERSYQELSGGEQQRVQLARVLAQVWEPVTEDGPRWLFLDEPVSSLDIGHQIEVMQVARDFADAGGGVIAVMHDLNLSAMFGDRMLCLSEGRIIAEGAPGEVMTDATLSRAYRCRVRVNAVPGEAASFILPHMAQAD
ncbi:heme ABC transporter ATP-binding protein [Roseivivax sediminis]|uniref:Iron complex transport system ATP-binding protein n=1 Tax=Roseivivax sediminis TaxID=936889 RepID=A0A1I2D237_9RHOB|nr:heme ABC transporter ATP-binding protein [Roseivivax sediminis]SFE74545.1 iron complex transport system ATP-binding protein [Roseivivax sediminis]